MLAESRGAECPDACQAKNKKVVFEDKSRSILLKLLVTTSKALVTRSNALVPSSLLFLLANIVTTSKQTLLLVAMHLFLVAS